jgi:hypothetical protein
MAIQLRIDNILTQGDRIILNYSHTTGAALPHDPMGYGVMWESNADMLAQLQDVRTIMSIPENMALLALLAAVSNDPTFSAPTIASLIGKTLTITPTATSPIGLA